jgi:hypothetical protein
MPRKDDHFHPEPSRPGGPAPESAIGGAGDSGAHGQHLAASPEMAREHRPPGPEDVPGDAAIERRRGTDSGYSGPERRLARR